MLNLCNLVEMSTLTKFQNVSLDVLTVASTLLPNSELTATGQLNGAIVKTAKEPWFVDKKRLNNSNIVAYAELDTTSEYVNNNKEFIRNTLIDVVGLSFVEICVSDDDKMWLVYRGGSAGYFISLLRLQDSYNINRVGEHNIKIESQVRRVKDGWITTLGCAMVKTGKETLMLGNIRDGSYILRNTGKSRGLFAIPLTCGRIISNRGKRADLDEQVLSGAARDVLYVEDESMQRWSPYLYKNPTSNIEQLGNAVDIVRHLKPVIHIRS